MSMVCTRQIFQSRLMIQHVKDLLKVHKEGKHPWNLGKCSASTVWRRVGAKKPSCRHGNGANYAWNWSRSREKWQEVFCGDESKYLAIADGSLFVKGLESGQIMSVCRQQWSKGKIRWFVVSSPWCLEQSEFLLNCLQVYFRSWDSLCTVGVGFGICIRNLSY